MRRVGALVAALALLPGGWGGCGDADRPQPGAESGLYAGSGDGVGALVDFGGIDATSTRIRERIAGDGRLVALVYLVNHGDRPVTIPTFTAERYDGHLAVLARADRDPRLTGIGLPRAEAVAADGAMTLYVLYRGDPAAVTRIGMRRGLERAVTLTPQQGERRPQLDG